MISKGCIYQVVRVRDVEFKVPTLDSIPTINEYFDVFSNELPDVPLEIEIAFPLILYLILNLFPYIYIE